MTEPRGAVTGGVPETLPDPEAPDTGSSPGGDARARPEDRLDASAHAHLLEEPLPPDAATETAVIYNVTMAAPHVDAEDDPSPAGRGRPGPVPRRSALGTTTGSDPTQPDDDAVAGEPHRETSVHHAAEAADRDRPAVARVPTARKVGAAAAVVLVAALALLSGYLWISATEWREQAGGYERTARGLGEDLATTRNQLAGSQAELEAVRAQLSTAHERIVELADEKNQALDDWEITQQLVDYQQRISEAAGTVALALDQCVQGQQELIGYLQQQVDPPPGPSATPYDPAQVVEFETQVEALCQEASEANIALQLELAR